MSPSFAAITTSAAVPDAGPAVVSSDFTGWRKSSRSNSGACIEVGSWRKPRRTGACVEVGHGPAVIGIRDSQDPDGATTKAKDLVRMSVAKAALLTP